MSATLGIVEVSFAKSRIRELNATRLATRRVGGQPLLEWVVRRVTDSLFLDRVCVVTEAMYHDQVRYLTPPDVAVYAGDEADPLSRFAAASRQHDAAELVRIKVDHPFVDPELIDRLICTGNAHPGCDYIGYYLHDGRPAVQSQLGVFAEWCRADAIYRAEQAASGQAERLDATRFLCSHPELFQLRLIPVPTQLDRIDVRLSVSGVEDWDNAQTIVDALGVENLNWQRIAELLDQQPELRHRMAVLNQAERE